jgi:predicted transcriptional regulator
MVDVMADILRVAAHPASKTQILYSANLSYEQAKKYS